MNTVNRPEGKGFDFTGESRACAALNQGSICSSGDHIGFARGRSLAGGLPAFSQGALWSFTGFGEGIPSLC
ncbi:MAG: hypothetical protein M2R46_00261 [Verrucomicrobia subdivision 3 bacterium]|nr:hypothetical protein [Limisphaerales bacterium]